MNKVNPPPLRIPLSLTQDRDTLAFLTELKDVLYQLWVRTGAGDDFLSNLSYAVEAEDSRKFPELRNLTKRLNQLEQQGKAQTCTRKLEQKIAALEAQNKSLAATIKRLENRLKDLELA